jgi:superfamily II DNA or RNA helicase
VSLAGKLKRYFDGGTKSRGDSYYRYGKVRIRKGSESSLVASVRGSGSYSYEVKLDFENNTLSVVCDCPYFEDHGVCKHIWATILAADAQGYLGKASSAPNLLLDDSEDEWDSDSDLDMEIAISKPQLPTPTPKPPVPKRPDWRQKISEVAQATARTSGDRWPAQREILYVLDISIGAPPVDLVITLEFRERKRNGDWGKSKPLSLKQGQIPDLPSSEDREILSFFSGGKTYYSWSYSDSYETVPTPCHVKYPLAARLMPLLARTGRCYLRRTMHDPNIGVPLVWDEGEPWRFQLHLQSAIAGWNVIGRLHRKDESMEVSTPVLITRGGLVFTENRVAPLAEGTSFEWLSFLRKGGKIEAPDTDTDELLSSLLCSPGLPPLEVPEELQFVDVSVVPRPHLRVRAPEQSPYGAGVLKAELSFGYEGRTVAEHETARGWYEGDKRRFVRRDVQAENAAASFLLESGVKLQTHSYQKPSWQIAPTKLPRIVRALVDAGWHVEADGKTFRRPGAFHMEISSGVDWFELHGEVQYGNSTVRLPELLQALRRGENMVRLSNGEYGLLPEEWMRRFGHVAGMGTAVDGHVRFTPSQVGLLDALLAAQPEARCDETFARVRQELCSFQGVQPAEQPAGFIGQLRDYQREGLGWMDFLRRFSLGGCLADDMGVGKTAQVLAMLENRRASRSAQEPVRPSLVVVPKSLVFNWKLEAARFTPQLRVHDYTGLNRNGNGFADCDIVLTTYGTLRRDALVLKEIEFDYVVLDEAQAIKNASTESAKAARLLRGQHRLALSGTPMENHLGELWTIFDFLNPGMLGNVSAFKAAGTTLRNPSEETRQLLARALRPFILRRTKEQVARELPPKTEQTVYCEMEAVQRKLYNELLEHYRMRLLKQIELEGMAKSKIQVLEALLRLRQAACHPGLLDAKRAADTSAKLDVLLAQLHEVLAEGHKALVFSQFTSLLRILRDRLEAEGITYEYLDGATRDRQARVEHFQTDPDCRLFLVSLKAGGLGLNLTAAEYVFLLDPWWNPAVEAQAVDRAHRIGQTRHVFAYRLITKDTVEEKVLQLQQTKRDLASAIISADNRLIGNLRREDLELLLS